MDYTKLIRETLEMVNDMKSWKFVLLCFIGALWILSESPWMLSLIEALR